MWDERSFDTRSFDERSWLFLIQTPYAELSRHERIYVRTALEGLYASTTVDQIFSVAERHGISILSAALAVTTVSERQDKAVFITRRSKRQAPKELPDDRQPRASQENRVVFARTAQDSVAVCQTIGAIAVTAERGPEVVVRTDLPAAIVITQERKSCR